MGWLYEFKADACVIRGRVRDCAAKMYPAAAPKLAVRS